MSSSLLDNVPYRLNKSSCSLLNGQMLHGADYNYEQWLDFPQILEEDLILMREAHINVLSVGIFSWSFLESDEGVFNFDWLDNCIEKLYKNGQKIILATPSGSKPAWLSFKYPEVCQMTSDGKRQPHGGRHNHCRTSIRYREAVTRINTELAKRYGSHPALILWHVSNEYNGMPCYCPECLAAFREWLKKRYVTLDALNSAWYTTFWSHRFSSWEQIYPADPSIHGLMLDWQRFTSDQTIDFYLAECEPLRSLSPDIPITTNFHIPDIGLDYHKFARYVDIISWDSYPEWHKTPDDWNAAVKAGFLHDMFRSFLGKPFLLMESSPSATNWQGISKKKKDGMHILSSLQAAAHGSDSVQYFQWRQSRGGTEKFHDSVVTHFNANDTRIFREVVKIGEILKKLSSITGNDKESQTAVVYDFQNGWALNNAQLPRNIGKNYQEECINFYGAFFKAGVNCDVIGAEFADFSKYCIIVLPMLYMLREETAEKIKQFVKGGGIVVSGYLSGIANENDLCYLGGTPGGLTEVFGIAVEETETIADYESINFNMNGQNYKASHYADRIRLYGAQVLGNFDDNEQSRPCVTSHKYGEGAAYYICTRTDNEFKEIFFRGLYNEYNVKPSVPWNIPKGISVQKRGNSLFIMNFNNFEVDIFIDKDEYKNLLNNEPVSKKITLAPYGFIIAAAC